MKIGILLLISLLASSNVYAVERSAGDMFRRIRCQNVLAGLSPNILNLTKLSLVRAELVGENGRYDFPNGVRAEGFEYGVYVYTEPQARDEATHFNRTNRPKDHEELKGIFDIVSMDQMKNMTILDFPSGKGIFVEQLASQGINIYGADIFLSRKALKTGRLFPANMSWTPFNDSSFNLVLSMHGPLSGRARISISDNFKEIIRILKLEGRLLLGRVSKSDSDLIEAEIKEIKELTFVSYHPDSSNYLGIVEIRKTSNN